MILNTIDNQESALNIRTKLNNSITQINTNTNNIDYVKDKYYIGYYSITSNTTISLPKKPQFIIIEFETYKISSDFKIPGIIEQIGKSIIIKDVKGTNGDRQVKCIWSNETILTFEMINGGYPATGNYILFY